MIYSILQITILVILAKYIAVFIHYYCWKKYDKEHNSNYRFINDNSFILGVPKWIEHVLTYIEKKYIILLQILKN